MEWYDGKIKMYMIIKQAFAPQRLRFLPLAMLHIVTKHAVTTFKLQFSDLHIYCHYVLPFAIVCICTETTVGEIM